ncbi:tRNA (adenosine(37)-N6)-threonylcarbamoyltransferase complex dimerization subunit type 1 TsaB [bacterium]|nr:MAG: tRNA (adenosine(37)-N6)-threonylcarbamoyltransferase complex dimerization subunit type 1 TsaB [bacterium]
MIILAIDTSTDFLSVAVRNGETIFELTAFVPKRHSELLDEFLKIALEKSNISASDVDIIALAIGPGSYTGLRVGVAFVQGFCSVFEKKIVIVDSLYAMASKFYPSEIPVAAVYDARAGHIYGAIFGAGEMPEPIMQSSRIKLDEFAKKISSYKKILLVGFDAKKFADDLQKIAGETEIIIPQDFRRPSASVVSAIAEAKAQVGDFVAPENLEPKYLHNFVPGKRKRKKLL